MITEAEMTDFLDENRDLFLNAARGAVVAKITESMKWNLPDVVHTEVTKFMKEEIAPEITKILKDEKGAIIEAAKTAAVALGKALAEKIVETGVKNMNSYQGKEVFKALFS